MKLLIEAFKSARKTEIILIIVAMLALLVCMYGSSSGNTTSTDEERRMERILSQIDGAGRVRVMLSEGNESAHAGAVIVAAGAGRVDVRLRLQQTVHTITGLELDRIEVVESKR